MGKIVKFCSSCDEGFAEKFGFCPNCAAPLEAFELNPLAHEAKAEESAIEPPTPAPIEIDEVSPLQAADETPVYDDGYAGDTTPLYAENADVIEDEVYEQYEPAEQAPAFAAAVPDTVPAFHYDAPTYDAAPFESYEPTEYTRQDDGGYYITVIEEKNGKQRNLLLLGSFFLMMTLSVGGTIVSLFQKDLGINAIGDERSLAYLIDEVPVVEEEVPKKKNEDKGGGGGGGGKEEPEPVNQGDLPDQQKNPIRPPDPTVHRADFELKTPPPSTEGDRKTPKVFNQWGDPNSRFANLSNGPGTGGGMGTGIGTGAGSGRGTGMGSGSGSGSGSGDGSGNGDGSGAGSGGRTAPPPPVGVTTALRIISKPRAQYTDAGRTNSVQGVVRLKVTLLASGQIGSITPISRLPHGMTEQAIAAARQIRFEPKKVNGVPMSVVQTVEYTFSLY